jgi:hypothetical protein
VIDLVEEVGDAVQPGVALHVRVDDVPRHRLDVCVFHHLVLVRESSQRVMRSMAPPFPAASGHSKTTRGSNPSSTQYWSSTIPS